MRVEFSILYKVKQKSRNSVSLTRISENKFSGVVFSRRKTEEAQMSNY